MCVSKPASALFPSQQSQLPHYPERKIAEFQLHIEALERQYKSFIAKLRALDPSCKRQPWTPRAYCKRRAETPNCPSAGQCMQVYSSLLTLCSKLLRKDVMLCSSCSQNVKTGVNTDQACIHKESLKTKSSS